MFCLASIQDYIDHSAKIGHKVIFASMSQLEDNLSSITLGSTYTYLGINESGTEILVRPYQSKTTGVIQRQYFNQPIAILDRVEAKHLPKSGTTVLFRNIPSFNYVVLPLEFYLFLIIVVFLYFITVTVIKKFYIKNHKSWL